MRKLTILVLLLAALCMPVLAGSPDFYLAQTEVLSGMGSRSWATGYAPTESSGYWTAYLPIGTDTEAEELTLQLEMENPAVSPFRPQAMETTVRRNGDGIFPGKLSLRLYADAENGDYPARLVISGGDHTAELPLTVHIRSGYSNTEKPTVETVLAASDLTVASAGECTLLVRNNSRTLELTSCVLRISEATGDLLPTNSDTLLLGSLLPGEEKAVPLPLTVSASAKVGSYPVKAELTYETIHGSGTWTEHLTVPVTQALRLEHGAAVMGDSVLQGNTGGVSMELMNLGAGEVKNIRMTLNLGDFVQEQTVLVGNLQSGESATGKLSFSAANAPLGTAEGRLTVVYEDAFGHGESFDTPLRVSVEAPKPLTLPEAEQKSGSSAAVWSLGSLCVVLGIALIVQGLLLHGKIRKLEEDKL